MAKTTNGFMLKKTIKHMVGAMLSGVMRALGPERLGSLLHLVRQQNPRLIQDWLKYSLVTEWPERLVPDSYLRKFLGGEKPIGASLALHHLDRDAEVQLDLIPSETTTSERRLLYLFFRFIWPGKHHVFEVGPFLGGTSRAIAMGMQANVNRDAAARMIISDRFSFYHTREALEAILKPLFDRGVLSAADRNLIGEQASFREIYRRIHEKSSYFPLMHIRDQVLPDLPEAASQSGLVDLAAEGTFSAFFVDGCKSWYSTKYFMVQSARSAAPGATYIFQDYAWHTCFWIPMCVALLKEHFQLIMYADATYVFSLVKPLHADDVERTIPDEPQQLDRAVVTSLFAELIRQARERQDDRGVVSLQIQQAGLLAYCGDKGEARRLLDALINHPDAAGYESVVAKARQVPTYYPPRGNEEQQQVTLD